MLDKKGVTPVTQILKWVLLILAMLVGLSAIYLIVSNSFG